MSIEIVEVTKDSQFEEYYNLPKRINVDNDMFVPSLADTDRIFHDKIERSKAVKRSTIRFLAIENGECVGRIMGLIYPSQNNYCDSDYVKKIQITFFSIYFKFTL